MAELLRTSQAPAGPPAALAELGPAAARVVSVANWMARRGLPAPPWQPDAAWLQAELPPAPRLDSSAMATIGALALTRTQAMAHLGLDPLQPASHAGLARAVTTLNARMPALSEHVAAHDPRPWQQLAAASAAADEVQKAAQAGQFAVTPEQAEAYAAPGGMAAAIWQPLIARVAALAPLLAAAAQMGAAGSRADAAPPPPLAPGCSATLAQAIRQMRAVELPKLAEPGAVAKLVAACTALAQLRESLGTEPARLGFADVARLVADKAARAAALIPARAKPPPVASCPTSAAPAAAVRAALSPVGAELAAIEWRVPAAQSVPVVGSLLPAAALVGAMARVLSAPAVQDAPCAVCAVRK